MPGLGFGGDFLTFGGEENASVRFGSDEAFFGEFLDCFADVDFADAEAISKIGCAGFTLGFDEMGDEFAIVFRNFPAVILASAVESFWVSDGVILTELSVGQECLRLGLDKMLDFLDGRDTGGCAKPLAGEGCGGGGKS